MNKEERINSFAKLGNFLKNYLHHDEQQSGPLTQDFTAACHKAKAHNSWFTQENLNYAFAQWADLLRSEKLNSWLSSYKIPKSPSKNVAVIMAGNIPLVGFHDFLSVLLSGHNIIAKLSSKDRFLLPALAKILISFDSRWADKIVFKTERLNGFDAVIATGSDNSSRYFEYYFGDKPHIIRKNRNGVAVLNGREKEQDLKPLGEDIFRYFGLGCRNVSKLFVPKNYDFEPFFKAIFPWKEIINHHKYGSNYDYNKAVYLMSDFKLFDNGFLLLKEMNNQLASPIAVLFYEFYETKDELEQYLTAHRENIQCILSQNAHINGSLTFGQSQKPQLDDYADGVDTMDFLAKI